MRLVTAQGVPEEFLDDPHVGPALEEVRGEGVSERVGRDALADARPTGGVG